MADAISEGLSQINFTGMSDFIMVGVLILFSMFILAFFLLKIMDFMSYNIEVIIKRQCGEATIMPNGKKVIPTIQKTTRGKIYNKKISKDTSIEYFKIQGEKFDYRNYMPDESFYTKYKTGIFDFTRRGIILLNNKNGALIPLSVSNPAMEYSNVNINEIISAIADSMKERDEFSTDFWTKYGTILTIASLIAFMVVGMIFIIKYQEVFWQNSMSQLNLILSTLKDAARPELPPASINP